MMRLPADLLNLTFGNQPRRNRDSNVKFDPLVHDAQKWNRFCAKNHAKTKGWAKMMIASRRILPWLRHSTNHGRHFEA